MGTSTISMLIFNSHVRNYQRVVHCYPIEKWFIIVMYQSTRGWSISPNSVRLMGLDHMRILPFGTGIGCLWFIQFLKGVPSGILTQLWKIIIINGKTHYSNRLMFNGYVGLPEDKRGRSHRAKAWQVDRSSRHLLPQLLQQFLQRRRQGREVRVRQVQASQGHLHKAPGRWKKHMGTSLNIWAIDL